MNACSRMPLRAASERLPREPNLGSLGKETLIEQHALVPPRPLRSVVVGSPRGAHRDPGEAEGAIASPVSGSIQALDYPSRRSSWTSRTNNNTDATERILREWVARGGPSLR